MARRTKGKHQRYKIGEGAPARAAVCPPPGDGGGSAPPPLPIKAAHGWGKSRPVAPHGNRTTRPELRKPKRHPCRQRKPCATAKGHSKNARESGTAAVARYGRAQQPTSYLRDPGPATIGSDIWLEFTHPNPERSERARPPPRAGASRPYWGGLWCGVSARVPARASVFGKFSDRILLFLVKFSVLFLQIF